MDKDDKEKVHVLSGGYAKVTDAAEKEAALPGEDDPYQAASKAESHETSLLVLVMGKQAFAPGGEAYHFLHYDRIGKGTFGYTPGGEVFRFLYADLEPQLIIVHGDGILRICHLIGKRKMPWIRVKDRDFRPAGARSLEAVITKIEVLDWKRPAIIQAKKLAEALEEFEDA